ncbi:hypothetical protein [Actinoplanes siamensis]|uniref:Uncharacterized protein n=1 Tax=Actinoplanes siamensis TaxID=1223317 RepID=A0A919NDM0_9ACTN|nr:hypothetical protein [Actinoplanes siamensis]GIF08789.1 hypothetical protein Asi03nite_63270 [Actinoplanes siamensis]
MGTPFSVSCGQEAAAAFAPDEEPLLDELEALDELDELDDEVLVEVEEPLVEAAVEAGVLSVFFAAASPEPFDLSALTLPERESLR